MVRPLVSFLVVAAATTWIGVVRAQSDVALDRFEPAPAGSRLFTLANPQVNGAFRTHLGVLANYADSPLVLGTDDGAEELGNLVDYQLLVHAQAALELGRALALEIDLPFVVAQGGDSPTIDGERFESPSGATIADLRLGGQVALLKSDGWLPAASLLGSLWLPTGDDESYAGSGKPRYAIQVLWGADYPSFLWRAAVGIRRQARTTEIISGRSGWTFAAGAAYRNGSWQVGPELFGTTAADGSVDAFTAQATTLEALLGARYEYRRLAFSLGAGPGLGEGAGTPRFRVVAGVTLQSDLVVQSGTEPTEQSSNQVPGGAVTAPNQPTAGPTRTPGSLAAVAPASAADRDGDGLADAEDACPDVVGVPSADPATRGCPPDTDRDGIVDARDACPQVPGVRSVEPSRNGCPPDRDGDGILDADDACPDTKGPAHTDPKKNGCTVAVSVQGEQLVLTEQIHFKTGSDEILAESHQLLGQLAQTMTEHPELARITVDGHTDNVGVEANNLALSRKRALAVVRWLVEHGIDERRLETRGLGPRQPIHSNETEAGRAKNRRVEFRIQKRTDQGAAGWKDGPVQ